MFSSIRTSEKNKLRVSELTYKLGLGAENVIARIAFSYSISQDQNLELSDIKDSKGKEYSKRVLFGEYLDIYTAMVCKKYDVHHLNKEIPRYLKMHIDQGLEMIEDEVQENPNLQGIDLVLNYISSN
jgi:DNA sulfur modification protein DndE